jgi:hypothetical protein
MNACQLLFQRYAQNINKAGCLKPPEIRRGRFKSAPKPVSRSAKEERIILVRPKFPNSYNDIYL